MTSNNPILLTDVPKHVISKPSTITVRRWVAQEIRGIILRSWLIAGRRYTDLEALREFLIALGGPDAAVGVIETPFSENEEVVS